MRRIRPSFLFIPLFVFCIAAVGSWFTSLGMDGWYEALSLPSWTPPGSVIGAVWTTIFVLSTISAVVLWNYYPYKNRFWGVMALFLTNAFLNAFWSYAFFTEHWIGFAIWVAAGLALTTYGLIYFIWPWRRWVALLLLPYALWVTFATYLNYVIWTLN